MQIQYYVLDGIARFIYIYIKSLGKNFGDQLKLSDIVKIRFQITAVANNIAVLTRRTKGNQ